jgi:hypothetical protein
VGAAARDAADEAHNAIGHVDETRKYPPERGTAIRSTFRTS